MVQGRGFGREGKRRDWEKEHPCPCTSHDSKQWSCWLCWQPAQGTRAGGTLPISHVWLGGCLQGEGSLETHLTRDQHIRQSDEDFTVFGHHLHPLHRLQGEETYSLCPTFSYKRFKLTTVQIIYVSLQTHHRELRDIVFELLMYFWDSPNVNTALPQTIPLRPNPQEIALHLMPA